MVRIEQENWSELVNMGAYQIENMFQSGKYTVVEQDFSVQSRESEMKKGVSKI